MTRQDLEFLHDYLVAMCLYNEMGYAMRQDTPEEMARVRAGFRNVLDLFLKRVGEDTLPGQILSELKSEFVLEDGAGIVLSKLAAFFPSELTDPLQSERP